MGVRTPRVYWIFNGILAQAQGTLHEFGPEVALWIQEHTDDDAYAYTYRRSFVAFPEEDQKRVLDVRELLARRAQENLESHVIAHSWGTRMVLDALFFDPLLHVDTLHLYAGAAEASCDLNHLNLIVERRQIERAFVYWSAGDQVLQAAKLSFDLFGTLGLVGPQNMSPFTASKVWQVRDDSMGHSGWFAEGEQFERFMRQNTYEADKA